MLPESVWLLSYPRSGNSMLASMALAAIPGCSFASVYTDDHDAPRFLNELRSLGVALAAEPEALIIKTHHWYEPAPKKIIWLVRDGRDAMCSYWHFSKGKVPYTDPVSFWEALRFGDPSNGVVARWDAYVAYVARLLEERNHLKVRYEALKASPEREMQRVADYLGLPLLPDRLQLVAFERAHAVNPGFYRQGEVGGYKTLYRKAVEYLERELSAVLLGMEY